MESTYRKYKDRGFRVLAFPANNFGGQEPGTNSEIKTFCTESFDVSFDLFAKISVMGEDQCDLYKYLTDEKADHGQGGAVKWNFQKYLVDRNGHVVAKYAPRIKPEDTALLERLEQLLAEPPDPS